MKEHGEVRCPICGSAARPRTEGAPAYWRCDGCRSAFLRPQPTDEELARYYESFHQAGEGPGKFAAFEGRMALDLPEKCRIVTGLLGGGPGMRLLDVGCGKGYFVAEAARHGFEAHGIDISEAGILAGRERFGLTTLRQGELGRQADWRGAFDVVTAWATIEHLRAPDAFLAEVRGCLRPGGLLVLDTGLAGDFVDEWLPGLTQWYASTEHMFVFSEQGLRLALARSGFEVVHLDRSFERSAARRAVKKVRNVAFAAAAHLLYRMVLGRAGFEQARKESKLPLGSLIMIGARLRSEEGISP